MKRAYQSPTVEKVEFRYNEQVLAAASTSPCARYINGGVGAVNCPIGDQVLVDYNT